jgi:hypothetical protein
MKLVDELDAHMKAQQAYTNRNAPAPPILADVYDDASRSGAIGRAARVPLKEQLEKTYADMSQRSERVSRAHDIITRHPEFEEFLELQDLINSGLYR